MTVILSAWPMLLAFVGGALGGALGGAAFGVNLAVSRTRLPLPVKIALNLVAGTMALGAWFAVALLVLGSRDRAVPGDADDSLAPVVDVRPHELEIGRDGGLRYAGLSVQPGALRRIFAVWRRDSENARGASRPTPVVRCRDAGAVTWERFLPVLIAAAEERIARLEVDGVPIVFPEAAAPELRAPGGMAPPAGLPMVVRGDGDLAALGRLAPRLAGRALVIECAPRVPLQRILSVARELNRAGVPFLFAMGAAESGGVAAIRLSLYEGEAVDEVMEEGPEPSEPVETIEEPGIEADPDFQKALEGMQKELVPLNPQFREGPRRKQLRQKALTKGETRP